MDTSWLTSHVHLQHLYQPARCLAQGRSGGCRVLSPLITEHSSKVVISFSSSVSPLISTIYGDRFFGLVGISAIAQSLHMRLRQRATMRASHKSAKRKQKAKKKKQKKLKQDELEEAEQAASSQSELEQSVNLILRSMHFRDVETTLDRFHAMVAKKMYTIALHLLPDVMELVGQNGSLEHYCKVLKLVIELDATFDAFRLCHMLSTMVARTPTMPPIVRLTLNLALPRGAEPLLPFPPIGILPAEKEVNLLLRSLATQLHGRVRVQRTLHSYFAHFLVLLHVNYMEEKLAVEDNYRKPFPKLASKGLANSCTLVKVGETSITLLLADPQETPIARGSTVALSRPQGPLRPNSFVGEGVLASSFETHLGQCVVVEGDMNTEYLEKMSSWRIDVAANSVAYTRQLLSLAKMAVCRGRQAYDLWQALAPESVDLSNVRLWTKMMEDAVMRSTRGDSSDGTRLEQLAGIDWKPLCEEEPPILSSTAAKMLGELRQKLRTDDSIPLTLPQRAAVAASLGRRVTLVQGPPGTGKTYVCAQLMEYWCKKLQIKPILATASTNVAVDNLAQAAMARGLKVVRIGPADSISPQVEKMRLERQVAQAREKERKRIGRDVAAFRQPPPAVDEEKKSAKEHGGKREGEEEEEDEEQGWMARSPSQNLWLLRNADRERDRQLQADILKNADVICMTNIAAGNENLDSLEVGALLIDEAAQASELESLVPIATCKVERLVLVGDHCQLPPPINSLEAAQRGLALSLFGRFVALGLRPHLLDLQFRMHPKIAQFSSQHFYGGLLKTGVAANERRLPDGFLWPDPTLGVAFVQVAAEETAQGFSYSNFAEARRVVDIVCSLLEKGNLDISDVGIITPYAAQVELLKAELARELSQRFLPSTGMNIASVDAFQGSEREVIVFSAVRANAHGKLGFLRDWRRLNVMLTRARRGLIVIGNAGTLSNDEHWEAWLEWARRVGACAGGPTLREPSRPVKRRLLRTVPST